MTCSTEPAAAPTARVRRRSRKMMKWLGMVGLATGRKRIERRGHGVRRARREEGEKNRTGGGSPAPTTRWGTARRGGRPHRLMRVAETGRSKLRHYKGWLRCVLERHITGCLSWLRREDTRRR